MAQLSRLMSRLNPTFAPCLPRPAKEPPAAPGWIHEIKHDGFRILAGRDRERVRLFTRHGTDFTARYPKIAAALASLTVRSCALDVRFAGPDTVEGASPQSPVTHPPEMRPGHPPAGAFLLLFSLP
jgi:hypothetical protein